MSQIDFVGEGTLDWDLPPFVDWNDVCFSPSQRTKQITVEGIHLSLYATS